MRMLLVGSLAKAGELADEAGKPRDEEDLIRSAQRGEVSAFAELVKKYEDAVYSLLVRWLQDRTAAEDVFQQAMLAAYRGVGTYQLGTSFRSWLFRVAVNAAKDALRAEKRETRRRTAWIEVADRAAHRNDDGRLHAVAVLEHALTRVSDADRLVLLLRFGEQLSNAEIGAMLGVPEFVVKMRVHRARARFRKVAGETEDE